MSQHGEEAERKLAKGRKDHTKTGSKRPERGQAPRKPALISI